jgi:hypothetical protein
LPDPVTAFAAALDALFADPSLSVAATWRPGGTDAGAPVRVVRLSPDRITSFGDSHFVTDAVHLEIRVAEAPALARGDLIEIAGESFEIIGEPIRDRERLLWTAEARAA